MGTELITKITDYIKIAKQKGIVYPLDKVNTFRVISAPIVDNAPVTNPSFYTKDFGLVKGRYIDVIAWAVQLPAFYQDNEAGIIKQEHEQEIRGILEDNSLDVLLNKLPSK